MLLLLVVVKCFLSLEYKSQVKIKSRKAYIDARPPRAQHRSDSFILGVKLLVAGYRDFSAICNQSAQATKIWRATAGELVEFRWYGSQKTQSLNYRYSISNDINNTYWELNDVHIDSAWRSLVILADAVTRDVLEPALHLQYKYAFYMWIVKTF